MGGAESAAEDATGEDRPPWASLQQASRALDPGPRQSEEKAEVLEKDLAPGGHRHAGALCPGRVKATHKTAGAAGSALQAQWTNSTAKGVDF